MRMHIRHLVYPVIVALLLVPGGASGQDTAAAGSGTVLWKHTFDGQIWSPLTHHDGVLYFGCDNGAVYAFDTGSQEVRWDFETKGSVRSAVVITGEKAIAASDDGFLYAVDLKEGKEMWRFGLGSGGRARVLPATTPPYEYDYMHSSPIVADGTVYIGSMDGNLYAVEADTGKEQWRFQTGAKVRSTPVMDSGTLFCASWDGHLYALDAGDGELRWKFDTGGAVQGAVAAGDGKVVVGSRSAKIIVVNAVSGEVEWAHSHKDGSWVESSPVIREGVVYIGSSDALKLFAFDLATGEELWQFKTDGWSWGAPVVTNDTVYIGGISASPYYFPGVELEPGFYAVDRESGEVRWNMTPGPIEGYITGGVFASPALADDVVFVAALDGTIYAVKE